MLEHLSSSTILMSITQFCADQLNIPEDDFLQAYSGNDAKTIWWAFRNALGRHVTDREDEKDNPEVESLKLEEMYSKAWVRAPLSLCHCSL